MEKHTTIIAGHDTDEQREKRTLAWLAQHGVTVEEWNGLQVLSITGGEVTKGIYTGEYVASFENADGDPELSSLTISLEVDPYDTRLYVEFEGYYGCTCKGLGCVQCNEEMAAIERGENPYQHHTPPTISPAFQGMMDSLLIPARPALTIDQDEAAQLNTFYSGIDA